MLDVGVAPAHVWVPDRVGSYGDEAADLAELAGRPLDPEQCLAVDAILSYGRGGSWAALEAAVVEARQNGKTGGIILPCVLADLFLFDADRVVWTAHLFKTARDGFNDLVTVVQSTPELDRRVDKISYANGEESVTLTSGATCEFLARSKGGGRGLGGKRLVLDEALFLSSESMGALIPTLSARPNPQIMYGSSAGVAGSDHLRSLRDRGRAGGDPSLVWVEWCAPGGWDDPSCVAGPACKHGLDAVGCALDDEDLWRLANPALDRRITREYVRSERRALPAREFGRERLGWWDDPEDAALKVPLSAWSRCADPSSEITGRLALVWEVAWDQSAATVAVAGRRADGLPHIEVVDHREGTEWVADRLAELVGRHPVGLVAADPSGPAGSLLTDVTAALPAELEPRLLGARDMAQACGGLLNAVTAGKLRHLGDDRLVRALRESAVRPLADAWAWDRKRARGDISPLVGVTVALWALANMPAPVSSAPLAAWA